MNPLANINPEQVPAEYSDRGLDVLSDYLLFVHAAEIIGQPKGNPDSFELHAPLELMARYRLLPLVSPAERKLARLQILATTALYQSRRPSIPAPRQLPHLHNWEDARERLERAMGDGDVELADSICVAIAHQFGSRLLIDVLAPKSIWSLAVACHAHIGLMFMMLLQGDLIPTSLHMLREIVRGLAADPQAVLEVSNEVSNKESNAPRRADYTVDADSAMVKTLVEKFSRIPRLEKPKENIIRAMVEAAEKANLLEDIHNQVPSLGTPEFANRVFQICMRTAAYSMLQDNWEDTKGITQKPLLIKYGWTHCLTLPQACWALAPLLPPVPSPSLAACSWVLGFRSIIGSSDLDMSAELPRIEGNFQEALMSSPAEAASIAWHADSAERLAIRTELATQAAIRHDTHLVKYVRACLDLSSFDREYSHLYEASAAYLCSLWMLEQPRESLEANLHKRSPF
jgi:hypothetical protein